MRVLLHFFTVCMHVCVCVCVCVYPDVCGIQQLCVHHVPSCSGVKVANWWIETMQLCSQPSTCGTDSSVSTQICTDGATKELLRWLLTQNTIITALNWSHRWHCEWPVADRPRTDFKHFLWFWYQFTGEFAPLCVCVDGCVSVPSVLECAWLTRSRPNRSPVGSGSKAQVIKSSFWLEMWHLSSHRITKEWRGRERPGFKALQRCRNVLQKGIIHPHYGWDGDVMQNNWAALACRDKNIYSRNQSSSGLASGYLVPGKCLSK